MIRVSKLREGLPFVVIPQAYGLVDFLKQKVKEHHDVVNISK